MNALIEEISAITGERRPVVVCTCCGHAGIRDVAKELARREPRRFPGIGFSVLGCGRCGHAMVFNGEALRDLSNAEAEAVRKHSDFDAFISTREECIGHMIG